MRYTSRARQHRTARDIAGAAMSANRAQLRLQRCRALLGELDPDRPPTTAQAREFRWQYRALRERVHLYSQCLEAIPNASPADDYAMRKAETALELSLQYFRNVLTPRHGSDDDGGEGDDA
jgi:hypothetical protein